MWLGGDSFDHYVTADLPKKYTVVQGAVSIGAGTGRGGTHSLRTATDTGLVGMSINTGNLDIFHAVAYKPSLIHQGPLAQLRDGVANIPHLSWDLNLDGSISVWRCHTATTLAYIGSDGGAFYDFLGVTAPGLIVAGAWQHLEFHTLIHASAGGTWIKINGHEVLALTGINTKGTGTGDRVTLVNFGGPHFSVVTDWDDLMIYDTSGDPPNASLGDLTAECLFPNGVGHSSGWTPSSGANYTCVDDLAPDDDTTTVTADTPGQKDTYLHTPLVRITRDIAVVQSVLTAKKSDSGTRALAAVTRVGATDYQSSVDHYLASEYAMYRHGRPVNPATSAAWLKAAVDASEIGQIVSV